MKKILSLLLIFNFIACSCFAADTVQVATMPVEIKSKILKEKYEGYKITFVNNGNNPVKILNIDIPNAVTNVEAFASAWSLQELKKQNKWLYLSPFTLGVTGFVYLNKTSAAIDKQKETLAEACKFNAQTTTLTSKSEIIMPKTSKSLLVAVPKTEAPNITAVFQDTKTNEYLGTSK